jgi:hypothetical protein
VPTPTIERAAARALAVLEDGRNVIAAIAAMREDASVRNIDCIAALRQIASIGLSLAMVIVDDPTRYAKVGLRELRHLVKAVHCKGAAHWLQTAIVEDSPWLLFVPNGERSVRFYYNEIAEGRSGTVSGGGVSLQRIRDELIRAVEDPATADEVRVMRDEPDSLLLYFPFVAR